MTQRKALAASPRCRECLAHIPHRAPEAQSSARLDQWLAHIVAQSDGCSRPLHPVLREFKEVIEGDSTIFMLFSSMFEQIPPDDQYGKDPIGRHQVKDYKHLLHLLNFILHNAPAFDSFAHEIGWVGIPINVVMNWPMSTPSGKSVLVMDKVNRQFGKVLKTWGSFLATSASAHVLHDGPGGWFSPEGLKAMEADAHTGLTPDSPFQKIYECDPSLPHYGYKSWDDFFVRRLRPGVRPVEAPDDPSSFDRESGRIIVNPCESTPFRVATNVSARDQFWIKSQPYSIVDMLAHDPLADHFEGGTVFQGLLGSCGYHRWHSPISGTVVRTFVQPGTYFSRAMYEGFGDGTNMRKDQGYVAAIATRGLIFIEADNRDLGLVCFIAVGLAEVSSIEIFPKEGEHVNKGDCTGTFHYGGSTFCLLLMPGLDLEWVSENLEDGSLIPVNSRLACLKGRS